MKLGYARVSTDSQKLDRQIDALKDQGCERIFEEKMTGTKKDRPQLNRLLDTMREGDIVIIESFSRLGRSTADLIELMNKFNDAKVKVISLKEQFDTTTPQGKLMMTMFSALSEFERDIIVQRTKEGLESARARGRVGGRPATDSKALERAIKLYNSKEYTVKEITEMTGVSRSVLYRNL